MGLFVRLLVCFGSARRTVFVDAAQGILFFCCRLLFRGGLCRAFLCSCVCRRFLGVCVGEEFFLVCFGLWHGVEWVSRALR